MRTLMRTSAPSRRPTRGIGRGLVALAAASSLALLVAAPSQARATWDTSPVTVTRHVHPTPKVVDLRVGEHRHFDRVVIDLRGKLPGYSVRYVRQLTFDASGEPVPLKGKRFIAIALTPAVAHNAQGRNIYRGPKLKQYHLPSLRGVAFTGDNEAVVSFGLALRHRDDFRVSELSSPSRLVIDLHH